MQGRVPSQKKAWLPEPSETPNYELPIPRQATTEPSVRQRKRDRDRAARIAAAGEPQPTLRERAVLLALRMGEVRTKDLTDIGIPRCYLARMCEESLLTKIGYGRYRAAVPKSPTNGEKDALFENPDSMASKGYGRAARRKA